jgi:hypothetical protein
MLNLYVATRTYDERQNKVVLRVRVVSPYDDVVLEPNEAIITQEFEYDECFPVKYPNLESVKVEEKHAQP